jgi:hypothetical protein
MAVVEILSYPGFVISSAASMIAKAIMVRSRETCFLAGAVIKAGSSTAFHRPQPEMELRAE